MTITSADVDNYMVDTYPELLRLTETIIAHISGYLSEYTLAEMQTAVDDALDMILKHEYWGTVD